MKAKLKFNLGEVKTTVQGQEVELKDISTEIDVEYTMRDTITMYKLMKDIIKDIPEILEDLDTGYQKFESIEKKNNKQKVKEEVPRQVMFDLKNMESEMVTEEQMEEEIAEALKSKSIKIDSIDRDDLISMIEKVKKTFR